MPSSELILPKYCESVYQTKRRPTRTVHVSLCAEGEHAGEFPPADSSQVHCIYADWQRQGGQRAQDGTADYDHHRHPKRPGYSGPGGLPARPHPARSARPAGRRRGSDSQQPYHTPGPDARPFRRRHRRSPNGFLRPDLQHGLQSLPPPISPGGRHPPPPLPLRRSKSARMPERTSCASRCRAARRLRRAWRSETR